MSHRIEIGTVEAYHDATDQAQVRLSVDLHDHHVVIETAGGDIDLGELHIEGADEVDEGDTIALDVEQPVAAGDRVVRLVED